MTEQSQNDVISYDDPTGRLERERILAQIRAASPSQDIAMYDFQALNALPDKKDKKKIEEIKVYEWTYKSVIVYWKSVRLYYAGHEMY